jgi:hypothetical protein
MKKVLKEVRGCLIHRCRIAQSKGAVMVALQAHAVISNCDINSVGYGHPFQKHHATYTRFWK